MATYEFSIIASGLDFEADDFEDHFLEQGCDDATLSVQKGRIIVDFDREAESLEAAIDSALAAVEATGAEVERIEPDPLVTVADIAKRAGLTRQAVSQYVSGARGLAFPSPSVRVTSQRSLWEWVTVAHWLFRREMLDIEALEYAEAIHSANERLAEKHSVALAAAG